MWKERAGYQEFPLKNFLGYIHQEKRWQWGDGCWIDKHNKGSERRGGEEAKKMKENGWSNMVVMNEMLTEGIYFMFVNRIIILVYCCDLSL